jgi:hypothetical protein
MLEMDRRPRVDATVSMKRAERACVVTRDVTHASCRKFV